MSEAARKVRYRVLRKACRQLGANVLLMAHNSGSAVLFAALDLLLGASASTVFVCLYCLVQATVDGMHVGLTRPWTALGRCRGAGLGRCQPWYQIV